MTRHYDIPDVTEQAQLQNGPVKVRFQGKDRSRVRRGLRAAAEDGATRGIAYPVVTRQQTQVVIKTEEELEAFRKEVQSKAKWRVAKRVKSDIQSQLNNTESDSTDTTESNAESDAVRTRRDETDMDTLLHDVVIPHARKTATETWPGGTVSVDEIKFFWNEHLTRCAGKAYWGSAIPRSYVENEYRLAVGLAPEYYYKHGIDALLRVVRHELIHIWQYEHEMGSGGHGKDFRQWLDDVDADRYCKHW